MFEGAFVSLFLGLLTLIFVYLLRTYTFWTRKGIKQITPVPFFGSMLPVFLGRKHHGDVYKEIYNTYPDISAVGYYQFLTPKLMLRNPVLIKQVLVSDFSSFRTNEIHTTKELDPYLELNPFLNSGDKWKKSRASLNVGLTSNKMKHIFPLMKETLPHLDAYVQDNLGKEIEAMDFSGLFFKTNVSNTVYGISENCYSDPNSFFRRLTELLNNDNWRKHWNVMIIFFFQRLKVYLGYSFIPSQLTEYGISVIHQVTEARLKSGIKRNDFLQYYLDRDKTVEEKVYELTNHAMTFFIGGMETSALTSSSALYELALHQDIQEELYQELEAAYRETPDIDFETLLHLPYLDQVCDEITRMYPVIFSLPKGCTKSTTLEIDGKVVKFNPGQLVMIPALAIHNDPKYYPNPEVFDPERFSEENKAKRPECTYLAFGEGPRFCVGQIFGMMQVKLFLAHLIHNYRVLPTSKTPPKINFLKTAYFVVPENEQWIKLEKRT